MMNFHILTLFPEMVMSGLNTSIIGRAAARGLLSIEAVNIRDYAFNKHQSVDDYPYGGGAGMLMQAEPVYLAYKAVEDQILARAAQAECTGELKGLEQAESAEQTVSAVQAENIEEATEKKKLRVVYLSPQGDTFSQEMAEELAKEEDLDPALRTLRGNRRACTGRDRDRLCVDRRLCADWRGTSGNGHGRSDLQTGSGCASQRCVGRI